MQFLHPESYRILLDDRILQDPMGSGVRYVDLGNDTIYEREKENKSHRKKKMITCPYEVYQMYSFFVHTSEC